MSHPTIRWVDFKNNPSIGWVHPKSTDACPLSWANKKIYMQTYHLIHSANF